MEPSAKLVLFCNSITRLLLPGCVQSVDCAAAGVEPKVVAAAPTPAAPAAIKNERRESPGAVLSLAPFTSVGLRSCLSIISS